MMPGAPWLLRVAIALVPAAWRESVARDLIDEAGRSWWAGVWCAAEAIGIAISLHWAFTRTAVMSDIRYAIRSMLHARWFSIGAVLTFALGIGVNVAVFSAVDRMLFRPLPFDRPGDLYVLRLADTPTSKGSGTMPRALFAELRQHRQGLVDLSQSGDSYGFTLSQRPVDEPTITLTSVTYNTLSVFGVHPIRGRDFSLEDAQAKRKTALIGYDLWQTRFAGRDDIVGQLLWTGGTPVEIVGVLPREFIAASTWFFNLTSAGLVLDPDTMDGPGSPNDRAVSPYVRLRPGVSPAAAEAELNALLASSSVAENLRYARLTSLNSELFGQYENYLVLVAVAAGLVLLITCGNLASLMLVRFRSREHITALQTALGASRMRLVGSAFIEASVLSIAGAVAGLMAFAWASAGLRSVLPAIFSRFAVSVSEPRVVVFTILMAFASAALVAILPAWRLARVDTMAILKRTGTAVRGRRAGGRGLLAIEATLCVVLVAAAVGTGRSLLALKHTDLGFEVTDLYRATVRLPPTTDANLRLQQYGQVLDVLSRLPGVRTAGATNSIFLVGGAGWSAFGKGFDRQGARSHVTAGFFETLGTPLLAGRTISTADVVNHASVAVLNRSGLELVWPGVSPAAAVGRLLPFDEDRRLEVVGVVGDMRSRYGATTRADIYLPVEPAQVRGLDFVARVDPSAMLSIKQLREAVRLAVADPTLVGFGPVATSLDAGLLDQKFRATLFISFGIIALVLAALGLYAVGTFEVTSRQAEMGIRITLGASAGDVRRLVIMDALMPVAAGLIGGLGIAVWAAKFLKAFLYSVDAADITTLSLVSGVLLTVTVIAAWLPARRAARTDPAIVLRAQ